MVGTPSFPAFDALKGHEPKFCLSRMLLTQETLSEVLGVWRLGSSEGWEGQLRPAPSGNSVCKGQQAHEPVTAVQRETCMRASSGHRATEHHRPAGLDDRNDVLTVLEAGSPRSRC